jgi:hypothetical protein
MSINEPTSDKANICIVGADDDIQGENLLVTIMAKEKYSGHIVVRDHPNLARWVTLADEDMRSIPAFERKKWFLDANVAK